MQQWICSLRCTAVNKNRLLIRLFRCLNVLPFFLSRAFSLSFGTFDCWLCSFLFCLKNPARCNRRRRLLFGMWLKGRCFKRRVPLSRRNFRFSWNINRTQSQWIRLFREWNAQGSALPWKITNQNANEICSEDLKWVGSGWIVQRHRTNTKQKHKRKQRRLFRRLRGSTAGTEIRPRI